MPYDGSGTFNRVMNWVNDALANIKIVAPRHDSEDDNFAAGLSNVICKDGQTSITANIPFNGKRITNLANPVNPQDAMTLAQMVASNIRYDVAQGLTPAQLLQAHTNLGDTDSTTAVVGAVAMVQADRHKLMKVIGNTVLNLPSAATVGNDWSFYFRTLVGNLTLHAQGGATIENSPLDYVVSEGAWGRVWCDGAAWYVEALSATLFKKTVVLATNAAFPLEASTKFIMVECQGAGGAGGSSTGGTTGTCGSGAGGGAGGYSNKFFARNGLTGNIIVGTGGAPTTTTGGTGGMSRWADNVNNVQGDGGVGGASTGATVSLGAAYGGQGGNGSGGDFFIAGGSGVNSISLGTSFAAGTGVARFSWGGKGGDSVMGPGGTGAINIGSTAVASFVDGSPGKLFGGGGGGGGSINTNGSGSGGIGAAGCVVVWEYH